VLEFRDFISVVALATSGIALWFSYQNFVFSSKSSIWIGSKDVRIVEVNNLGNRGLIITDFTMVNSTRRSDGRGLTSTEKKKPYLYLEPSRGAVLLEFPEPVSDPLNSFTDSPVHLCSISYRYGVNTTVDHKWHFILYEDPYGKPVVLDQGISEYGNKIYDWEFLVPLMTEQGVEATDISELIRQDGGNYLEVMQKINARNSQAKS